MEFVGNYIGGIASEWIESTVEGAKTAAAAYGGNLAGDAISYGGGLIQSAGTSTGTAVAGAFKGYGDWINGYGDKLRGAPASSLPTSGPLATYKAGGTGSLTLKRSSSYGPASSGSKALTKTGSTVAKTGPKAVAGVGKGTSGAVAAKPYTATAAKKDTGSVKKQTSTAGAKGQDKPVYPGTSTAKSTKASTPAIKRPTPKRTQSLPKAATNPAGKVKISAASKPQPKGYTPYKDTKAKPVGGGASKVKDAIPLGGIGGGSQTAGGAKGYTPAYKPGGGDLGKVDRSFF